MKMLFFILIVSTSISSTLSQAETYAGRVDFKDIVPLSTTISGTITSVMVKQGERVMKGATLLTLDDTVYQAKKTRQQAALTQALITQRRAKRDYQHAQELYQRAALSTVELEDTRLKLEHADARASEIRAELTTTQYELSQCKMVAPFDGWVTHINVSVHETVVNTLQAKTLLSLATADQYIVQTTVPLARFKTLLQQQHTIRININGSVFTGHMTGKSLTGQYVDNRPEPYYDVLFEFHAGNQLFVRGESAQIEF